VRRPTGVVLAFVFASAAVAAQQMRFDDVVRNLRNPDPRARLTAIRLLRESKHPEAIAPMVPLVNDPLDDVQLEAIAAELSFFLVEDVPSKKRVGFVVEVRNAGGAATAFEQGPLAVWPRPVPSELVLALLKAVDDENGRVRLEAIYTMGTIVRGPLEGEAAQQLVKALDHYDPAIRVAAARTIGRVRLTSAAGALLKAVNDSQPPVRFAAMRALGEIGDEQAVQALTEQLNFYAKGEGAFAALYGLARIAHPSSVPAFKSRLADKDPFLRRAAAEGLGRSGDTSEVSALEIGAGNDASEPVRAAMAFALQKLGKNYIPRLVESLDSSKMAPQIAGYLLELGPHIVPELVPHLQDPDPAIRGNTAQIIGALGGDAAAAALETLLKDRDRDVVQAATRALERLKMK